MNVFKLVLCHWSKCRLLTLFWLHAGNGSDPSLQKGFSISYNLMLFFNFLHLFVASFYALNNCLWCIGPILPNKVFQRNHKSFLSEAGDCDRIFLVIKFIVRPRVRYWVPHCAFTAAPLISIAVTEKFKYLNYSISTELFRYKVIAINMWFTFYWPSILNLIELSECFFYWLFFFFPLLICA